MEIEFDCRLFNPIYFEIQKYLKNKDIRHIWLYGGSSSSKTYSVVQATIVNMLSEENYNTMVFRKFLSDVKSSIYTDFKNIIKDWGIEEHFLIQQNYILCQLTGNYVIFKGLDSDEKIKGLSGVKKIIIDEITQLEYEIYKQLRKRLRGSEGQQIIGLFNPVSENHWLKTKVFDSEELIEIDSKINSVKINDKGNVVILHTNYKDNRWIVGPNYRDIHVIEEFEKDKINDFAYYQIYAMGNWGTLKTGGELLKKFDANIHIKDLEWNKQLPLHLTFDENVNPYLTLGVFQIEGKNIRQIDEICLEDPKNTLVDTCNEFKIRYPNSEVNGLFITGDRTSIKQDVKLEKGQNFFTIIQQHLVDYRPRLRIGTSNPSVVVSVGFFNAILGNNFNEITFIVDRKCKKSINDYMLCLEDSDGTIKKTKKTNPLTKVTYEEYGHHVDSTRYLLVNSFPNDYQLYQTGNKQSNIRMGKTTTGRHTY